MHILYLMRQLFLELTGSLSTRGRAKFSQTKAKHSRIWSEMIIQFFSPVIWYLWAISWRENPNNTWKDGQEQTTKSNSYKSGKPFLRV